MKRPDKDASPRISATPLRRHTPGSQPGGFNLCALVAEAIKYQFPISMEQYVSLSKKCLQACFDKKDRRHSVALL
jgi:hypothetical protein